MEDNFQYSRAKLNQIRICNRKDEDGFCQELKTRTDENKEEKYYCESLIKKGSCPL